MKKILPIILILLSAAGVSGQNINKAFSKLQEKEFNRAKEIFAKAIKNKKDPLAARFGMAMLYADTSYSRASLSRAHRYCSYVLKRWERLQAKEIENYQDEYQLNYRRIQAADSLIQLRAYQTLKNEYSEEKMIRFEREFKETAILQWMKDQKALATFKTFNVTTPPQTVDSFLLKYPHSAVKDSALALSQKLWMNLYNTYRFDGDLSSLTKFEQNYENHKISKDTLEKDKEIALLAKKLTQTPNYSKTNEKFYRAYFQEAAHNKTIAFVLLQKTLKTEIINKNWDKALEILRNYKPYFSPDDKRVNQLEELLQATPLELNIEKLPEVINSDKSEYIPVISADNKQLYFCGFQLNDGEGEEDIFVSTRKNNTWSKPVQLAKLNTDVGFEAPLALSVDGNQLLFFQNRQIYLSKLSYEGWDSQEKLPKPINSSYWQGEAQFTSDGKAILFVSDRPGGQGQYHQANRPYHGQTAGNIDIYIAFKQAEGLWSEPINLGATINTPFCERGIFLHPDMKTLYFSSDGHGGLGGMDIYKSTRLSDSSWTKWSEPVNLGKSINTAKDDWGYKITTDGTQAYFAAQEGKSYDIFVMDLPESIRPQAIGTISGKLLNTQGIPLQGKIKWEDLTTGELIGEAESHPVDGGYFLVVPLGKNYGYYVEKEGYFPSSSNIDLSEQKTSIHVEHNIVLQSIEEMKQGASVRLNNLFFDTGKFEIKEESFPELKRVARLLQLYPDLRLEIGGHTDNRGDKEQNQILSEKRAVAVKHFLVKEGSQNNQLSTRGYGQSLPVETNNTTQGRAQNRRVELRVQ